MAKPRRDAERAARAADERGVCSRGKRERGPGPATQLCGAHPVAVTFPRPCCSSEGHGGAHETRARGGGGSAPPWGRGCRLLPRRGCHRCVPRVPSTRGTAVVRGACMHAHRQTHTHVHTYTQTYTCMHTRAHTQTHMCTHTSPANTHMHAPPATHSANHSATHSDTRLSLCTRKAAASEGHANDS